MNWKIESRYGSQVLTMLERLSFVIVMALSLAATQAPAETADSVFYNGRLYTVDDRQPWAEALAVKGTRLIYVGNDEDVEKYISETTRVIDLQGQMAMCWTATCSIFPLRISAKREY